MTLDPCQLKINLLVDSIRIKDEEIRLLRKRLEAGQQKELLPPPAIELWIRNQIPQIINAARLLERYADDDSDAGRQIRANAQAYLDMFLPFSTS